MAIEKAQKDFDELIAKNGFTLAGYTIDTGNPIYHRVWKRMVQVAWRVTRRIHSKYGSC